MFSLYTWLLLACWSSVTLSTAPVETEATVHRVREGALVRGGSSSTSLPIHNGRKADDTRRVLWGWSWTNMMCKYERYLDSCVRVNVPL